MHFHAADIARATNGELDGDDVLVDGVTIDSREVQGGELFVPVVGERDGHDFVVSAVAKGAAAYFSGRALEDISAPAILVDDTGRALADLGRLAREQLTERVGDRVVGITGSVGKTTVKDLTAAALRERFVVHASPRSFNNELGVPLTLANSPPDVDAIVVEMGARGRGHVAHLCEIARPAIGIVTTVALAHAEMFGTIEEVAAAKSELVAALPASGVAVLNGDHPLVAAMAARTTARVLMFGLSEARDVTASDVTVDHELRPSFLLQSPWGDTRVQLNVRGAHQVMNALAAASAALAAGVTPDEVAAGLEGAVLSPWRMELHRAPSGAFVVNDAYNANPTSMEAALQSLAALPVKRRFAIVGVMAELGADADAEHRRISQVARELGIDVVAVDAPAYAHGHPDFGHVTVVAGFDEAIDALQRLAGAHGLGHDDAILVKGSRVAGLEQLAHALLAGS